MTTLFFVAEQKSKWAAHFAGRNATWYWL